MNQTRLNILLGGQTRLAQRVYEAVPIQETWRAGEIKRHLPDCHTEVRVIEGALQDLVDAGLVREGPTGYYRRAHRIAKQEAPKAQHATQAPQDKPTAEEPMTQTATTSKPKSSHIEILSEIASEVTAMAADFNGRLRNIAKRVEDAALQIEQEREADAKGLEKLHQLQALLKAL